MSSHVLPLPLFAGIGVELEYMIVDQATMNVCPLSDRILRDPDTGQPVSSLEVGRFGWSNELALHVIELKTKQPAPGLEGLPGQAQEDIRQINNRLEACGARLLPTAMHPWMNPLQETRLWPHDYNPVYEAFHRVFNCQGHGWSNLQSMHINLPFSNDAEFARLHAAIRLLLPLLPALAASSPLQDGQFTGWMDSRLRAYRNNCARIPSITGHIIPEPVWSQAAYQSVILHRIYRDIAPFDPEGILQEEWLNARGAIARFDRNAIEIRVLDIQECPKADLAIAASVVALLKSFVAERWATLEQQQSMPVSILECIFLDAARDAGQALVRDIEYLRLLGLSQEISMADLWGELISQMLHSGELNGALWGDSLQVILDHGCLARRIRRAVGPTPDHTRLHQVYARLSECLQEGQMFLSPNI